MNILYDHFITPTNYNNQDFMKIRTIESVKFTNEFSEMLDINEKLLLKDIFNILNSSPLNNQLKFGFNDDAHMSVVEIYDMGTNKLIRQFPTKEFFSRLRYFKDNILPGLLIDETI